MVKNVGPLGVEMKYCVGGGNELQVKYERTEISDGEHSPSGESGYSCTGITVVPFIDGRSNTYFGNERRYLYV